MLFCNKLKTYTESSVSLFTEAIEISKEINLKAKDLASSLNQLAECYAKIGFLNSEKNIKIPAAESLWSQLSKTIEGTAQHVL